MDRSSINPWKPFNFESQIDLIKYQISLLNDKRKIRINWLK